MKASKRKERHRDRKKIRKREREREKAAYVAFLPTLTLSTLDFNFLIFLRAE